MCIFRENSEDIYAGIEWRAGTEECSKVIDFLQNDMDVKKIRFDQNCGIGIKPVSEQGTKRLVAKSIQYAIDQNKPSVTLVHKGNIMKFTEGAFCDWGYEVAREQFDAQPLDGGPWHVLKNPNTGEDIIVKDVIADAMLQQIILRPDEYSVIATLNLNGDYISDALAAQVGGIGIAPGPIYLMTLLFLRRLMALLQSMQVKIRSNPGSLILSAEMMLRHLGWFEAADLVVSGIEGAISQKKVTYDFERLMDGAELKSCSAFGEAIIENM